MTDFKVDFNGAKKSANVKLDDFREMVNYDNTKNKGYVRMALGSDGKVFLQKINNKIDVPLSFRSNVKAHNNKELRELFSKVMANDLKYVDSYFKDSISSLITQPRDGLKGVNTGKALSRVDVRAIFEKFDTQFNTEWGRQSIIHHFMEHARAELGISRDEVSDEDFRTNYLRLDKHGLDNLEAYFQVKEGTVKENVEERGTEKINIHEQMVKTETEFRTLIAALETRLDVAKQYVGLTNTMQHMATRRLDNLEGVSPKLTEEEESTLRARLKAIATEEGFADLDGNVDGMLGTSGGLTEMFLKKIIPPFLCQGIINVHTIGGKKDSETYQQAMTDNFGLDAIMELYRSFLNGAREHIEDQSLKTEVSEKELALVAQVRETGEFSTNCAIILHVRDKLYFHANMSREMSQSLAAKVADLKESFRFDSEIGKYTIKYVCDHFAKMSHRFDMTVKDTNDVVKDYTDKLVTAAQIQFGARDVVGNNKARNYASSNEFISKMCSEILPEAANMVKGGRYVYDKLVEKTLPAMMNRVIEQALAQKELLIDNEVIYTDRVGADLAADPYKTVKTKVACLVSSYDTFRNDKLETLFSRAVTAFEKYLQGLAKRHKLPESAKLDMMRLAHTFSQRLKEGTERIIDDFFSQNLYRNIDNPKELQETMVKELVSAFNSERETALGELYELANAKALVRLPGNHEVDDLSNARKNVGEYLHNHPEIVQTYGEGVRDSLERIYTRIFAKQLAGTRPKKFKLPEGFAAKFQSTFDGEVKKFFANYEKFSKGLDKKIREDLLATCRDNLDPQGLGSNGILKAYTDLSKEDKEFLAQSLTTELVQGLDAKIQQIKKDFVENPEKYKKYDLKQIIENKIVFDTSTEGLFAVLVSTLQHREQNAKLWMCIDDSQDKQKNEEFKAGIHSLAQRELNHMESLSRAQSKVHVATLDYGEIENLATPVANAQIAKLEKYVYLYGQYDNTEVNQLKFIKRFGDEVKAELQKSFDMYNPFREEFLSGVPALKAKYSALTDVVLLPMIQNKLDDYSRACRNLPKVKDALAALDEEMKTKEKKIIEEQIAAAKAAREKRTKAYNNAMGAYTTVLTEGEPLLREAGAQDEDIEFLRKELVPVMRDNFSCKINLSPDEFMDDAGVEKARHDARFDVESIADALKKHDLTSDSKLVSLATSSGLRAFMSNPDTKERVMEALHMWVNSDDGKEFQKQNRKSAMTITAYRGARDDNNARFAFDVLNDIRDSVRQHLLGFLTEQSISRLNEKDLPMALGIFRDWLKQFNLPDVKIEIVGKGDMTLNDVAMDMFNQRVAEVMKQWSEDPKKKIQLLDPAFIQQFLTMVNTLGLEVLIGEIGKEFEAGKLKEFTSTPENQRIFSTDSVASTKMLDAINAAERQEVMLVNYRQLINCIHAQTSNAAAELIQSLSSVEDLSRWQDKVTEVFNKGFDASIGQVMQVCKSRMTMLDQLPGLEAKMDQLCDEACDEFFDTDLNAFNFSSKFGKVGSPTQMRSEMKEDLAREIFADVKANLTIAAQKPVSAYSTVESTFPTDPEEGKTGTPRLSNIIKDRFKAFLVACREDKKNIYAPRIKLMESEIRTYKAKQEAEARKAASKKK